MCKHPEQHVNNIHHLNNTRNAGINLRVMSTLGGVSLVQQPPHSTLAEQQLNLSFTGKEYQQDPLRKNKHIRMEICAFTNGQRQSLTFRLVIPTPYMDK
ncbi:hypothetical protein BTVI_92119 [Pitangus sulphuratus]|nr:hypothetical protein BTVI_92119 [Pitangus sulphuratus]